MRGRRVAPGLCASVLLAALAACPDDDDDNTGARFTVLEEGVEYARFHATAPEREGGAARFSGHAFRFDLDRVGLRVLSAGGPSTRREVTVITRSLPRVVAVNGSFFTPDGKAMGLVVDEGRLVARKRQKKWGALVLKDRRARIVAGSEVDLAEKPEIVVQGIPRLVESGRAQTLKPQSAERTAICLPDSGGSRYLVLVSATRVDASAFAAFLARPAAAGGLGCKEALNLDGGPSAQLVARVDGFAVTVPGGDSVPNALAAIPGHPNRRREDLEEMSGDGGAAAPPLHDVDVDHDKAAPRPSAPRPAPADSGPAAGATSVESPTRP